MPKSQFILALAGAAAGVVNGLFGAGGGMVLLPLIAKYIPEERLFPSSLAIITPISLASLLLSAHSLPWSQAWPYLLGGIPGGLIAATLASKIRTKWLHRIFGGLILYAGVRYLC